MAAELSSLYEWQLRAYMYLYDVNVARLRYCLVNCPHDVLEVEYQKFCFKNNIIDDANDIYKDQIAQFFRNYIYDEKIKDYGLDCKYTNEERVKTFLIVRDLEKEKQLIKAIELAVDYYKSIKLNMI